MTQPTTPNLAIVASEEVPLADRLRELLESERAAVRARLAALRTERDAANRAIRGLVEDDETLGQVIGVFQRRTRALAQLHQEGGEEDAETTGS